MMESSFKILMVVLLFNLCYCESKRTDFDTNSNQLEIKESGRTLDLLSSLGNIMFNKTFGGINFSIPGSSNVTCPNNVNLLEQLQIPLYIIVPTIIAAIVIIIKAVGLFVVWIPSVTGKWFKGFKQSDSDDDMNGWGWPSGSGGYPSASPSPAYGPPPSTGYGYGGSTNSRQTAVLESIDNLNNQYGYPDQPQLQSQGQGQSPFASGASSNNNNVGDYSSDDAQNYMQYYYNQQQQQQQQPSKLVKRARVK